MTYATIIFVVNYTFPAAAVPAAPIRLYFEAPLPSPFPCAQGAGWLSFPYIFIFCGMCGACECLKTLGEPPRS